MPVPGIRGMDHVGFTVPDLDAACEFFADVLGAEVIYTAATDFKADDDWMAEHLHVDPRAVITEFRYVRLGNGSNLEIFEYQAPDQAQTPPRNSDVGGHHLAFYVDDIYAAVAYLKERGVEVLGEPTVYEEGPNVGLTWCYFMAPWGMQLEVVSAPEGTVYDNDAKSTGKPRLFNPAQPQETLT